MTDPVTTVPAGLAARAAALRAIATVEDKGAYSNIAVPAAVDDLDESRDRALASKLAYESLRWTGTLDWALALVLDRPTSAIEPALLRVLRLGAVQLLQMRVPPRAAVSTSVDLARAAVPPARADSSARFVNGVLRSLDRRRGELPWPDEREDPITSLALTTAHPAWVVIDLVERLGVDAARAVLEGDDRAPGLTLRATRDRGDLIAELAAGGVEASPGTLAPEAVRAPGADPRRLRAVTEGRAVPQDEASMLVVHAARVESGHRVLDLCAGPGGKSTHLAQLAGHHGSVTAVEQHGSRAKLVRSLARRVGVQVTVRVGDAADPPVDGLFDVVLVDAPCSALGTGRRRPEVRWRRTPEDVSALAAIQSRILDGAAARVAVGGHLTYAACTWTVPETSDQIARLLAAPAGAGFELVEQTQRWPDPTDGMFHATLRRVSHRGPAPVDS